MTQSLPGRATLNRSDISNGEFTPLTTDSAYTKNRQSTEGLTSSATKSPRMLSKQSISSYPLFASVPEAAIQDTVNEDMRTTVIARSPQRLRLDLLARHFECFFWRPSQATRSQLMKAVAEISESEFSLEGTDAASLVSRIFRSHGLFIRSDTHQCGSGGLGVDDIRLAVSATLHCLAQSSAKLFNFHEGRSLAYLLTAAEENGLLPELEALIDRDTMLCGEHRVLCSVWDHAERSGIPLQTIPILVYLSECLRYPIPEDVPLLNAIQLIQHWQRQQPPSEEEQDNFETQLCAMTGPETSPNDFEDLLEMAFALGFCFADDSLDYLISRLIVESERHLQRDQYRIKLGRVLELTNRSANDIVIDDERALSRAVRHGDYRLFTLLLKHGADPGAGHAHQPSALAQLSQQRSALISEIEQVVKAHSQFKHHQYKKITSALLAQLRRNDRMLSFLEKSKRTDQ